MVQAKTEQAKRVLSRFVEDEEENRSLPKLDYSSGYGTGSKYAANYLKKIMDLLYTKDATIKLSVGKDYPATFENKDFSIILAPRIED